MAWDDEKRATAVELYEARNTDEETSTEAVTRIAEELNESIAGVRTILTRAGVYVSDKQPAASKPKSTASGEKGTRVSKEAAIAQLTAAIEAAGKEVNEEIVTKLTGKAALYFANLLSN